MTTKLLHRPHLDGLRGLAIIFVVLGHLELINGPFAPRNVADSSAWLESLLWQISKFGWVGVDLFFVLSGYLIMRIVAHSVDSIKSAGIFFARRFIRIFPLFICFVGVYFFATQKFASLAMPGSKAQFYFEHQFYIWFQAINFLREDGVFPQGELAHLWSLAIEEQFYLVLPLVFLAIRVLFRQKAAKAFLVFLCFLLGVVWAFKVSVFTQGSLSPLNAYVSTFIRAESIIWGVLIAYVEFYCRAEQFKKLAHCAVPLIGAGAFLLTFAIARAHSEHPILAFDMRFTGYNWWIQSFGFSGLSMLFAGVLLYALNSEHEKIFMRMLNNRVLKIFGKYCYGIYMSNTLVIGALVAGGLSWFRFRAMFSVWTLPLYFCIALLLCLLLALCLWWAIEARALALKKHRFFASPNVAITLRPAMDEGEFTVSPPKPQCVQQMPTQPR